VGFLSVTEITDGSGQVCLPPDAQWQTPQVIAIEGQIFVDAKLGQRRFSHNLRYVAVRGAIFAPLSHHFAE
jgi:hypothetical protein